MAKPGFGFKTGRNSWLTQGKDTANKLNSKLGNCAGATTVEYRNHQDYVQPRTAAWQKQEILSEVTGTLLRISCGQLEKLPFLRIRQLSERSGFGSRVPPCRWPLPNTTAQRLCFEQDCSSAFAGTLWKQHFLLSFNRHNEEAIFLRESNQKTDRISVMFKVSKNKTKQKPRRKDGVATVQTL